jgi:hypothetical protein
MKKLNKGVRERKKFGIHSLQARKSAAPVSAFPIQFSHNVQFKF